MTRPQAIETIERFCPPAKHPVLSPDDVEALADEAAAKDKTGATPDPNDPKYANRITVARAIASGWRIKEGLAAGDYDFGTLAKNFDRSQVMDHCRRMAETWEAKASGGRLKIGKLSIPDLTKIP